MDGVFVPNITIGLPVVKAIRPATALPLDVHLMIVQPGRYAAQFCDAGADIVTMHVESDTEANLRDAIEKVHAKGKRAGVVVKPGTPAEAVLPYIRDVEMILVMRDGFSQYRAHRGQITVDILRQSLITGKSTDYQIESGGQNYN